MARKIDPDEFARLYAQGWTIADLARHFGAGRSAAVRMRDRLGLPLKRSHELTPERVAHLRRLVDDGWSFAEIARTEHVSRNTLERYFPGRAWGAQQRDEFHTALRRGREALASASYSVPAEDRWLRVA